MNRLCVLERERGRERREGRRERRGGERKRGRGEGGSAHTEHAFPEVNVVTRG